MQTLTYFINDLYESLEEKLGETSYQTLENKTMISVVYKGETISGSLVREMVFEDAIFEDCTFFGTNIENCIFINCLFINCKFQFSKFSNCNFENTVWENCIWGLSGLKNSEIHKSEETGSHSFNSSGPTSNTKSFSLNDFLNLTA